ncbi:MAG: RNA-dependent RNA polymerase [Sanya totivirus 7]|nr:MAG: RNA-dependent RNA polymerase [Sanya totivirus 7]
MSTNEDPSDNTSENSEPPTTAGGSGLGFGPNTGLPGLVGGQAGPGPFGPQPGPSQGQQSVAVSSTGQGGAPVGGGGAPGGGPPVQPVPLGNPGQSGGAPVPAGTQPPLQPAPQAPPPAPVVPQVRHQPFPLPQNPYQRPAGITRPTISPIEEDGEPEAKGYVSSRYATALAPSAFGTGKPLKTVYVRVRDLHSAELAAIDVGKCNLDLTDIKMEPHEVGYCRRNGVLTLAKRVMGTMKGTIRTCREFRISLDRCNETFTVLRGGVPNITPIVLEPAFAAAFAVTTDDAATKSRKVLSQAFPDASSNLTEVTIAVRHGASLIRGGVEATRYVARGAMFYVETSFAQRERGDQVAVDVPYPVLLKRMSLWQEWRQDITDDAGTQRIRNYVPWWGMTGSAIPQEVEWATILRTAAAPVLYINVNGEWRVPMCWPEIPEPVFLTTLNLPDNPPCRMAFHPTTIYQAFRAWCKQYLGGTELFDEYVQFFSTAYWKREDEYKRLIAPFPRPTINMPEASMRPFILAPFMKAENEQGGVLEHMSDLDHNEVIAEGVGTALLVGYAAGIVRWQQADYPLRMGIVHPREIHDFTNLFRRDSVGVPLWGMTQSVLKQLGYTGNIGKQIGGIHMGASSEEYAAFAETDECRIMSGHLLPYLPRLMDGCAAQGWHDPLPLGEPAAYTEQLTLFADIGKVAVKRMMASLQEVLGVEYYSFLQHRNSLDVSASQVYAPERLENGMTKDFQMMGVTDSRGHRVRWGYVLPQTAVMAVSEPTHDRFNLSWRVENVLNYTMRAGMVGRLPGVMPDPDLDGIPARALTRPRPPMRRVQNVPLPPAPAPMLPETPAPPVVLGVFRPPPPHASGGTGLKVGGQTIGRTKWMGAFLPGTLHLEALHTQAFNAFAPPSTQGPASPQPIPGTSQASPRALSPAAAICEDQRIHVLQKQTLEWLDPTASEMDRLPTMALELPFPITNIGTPEELVGTMERYFTTRVMGRSTWEIAPAQRSANPVCLGVGDLKTHRNKVWKDAIPEFDVYWKVYRAWDVMLVPILDSFAYANEKLALTVVGEGGAEIPLSELYEDLWRSARSQMVCISLPAYQWQHAPDRVNPNVTIYSPSARIEILAYNEEVAREITHITIMNRWMQFTLRGIARVAKIELPRLNQRNNVWAVEGLAPAEARFWTITFDADVASKIPQLRAVVCPWFKKFFNEAANVNGDTIEDEDLVEPAGEQQDWATHKGTRVALQVNMPLMDPAVASALDRTEYNTKLPTPPPVEREKKKQLQRPLSDPPTTRQPRQIRPDSGAVPRLTQAEVETTPPLKTKPKGPERDKPKTRSETGSGGRGKGKGGSHTIGFAFIAPRTLQEVRKQEIMEWAISLGETDPANEQKQGATTTRGEGEAQPPAEPRDTRQDNPDFDEWMRAVTHAGVGQQLWREVMLEGLDRLLTAADTWPQRRKVYNLIDGALTAMRIGGNGWSPVDGEGSPLLGEGEPEVGGPDIGVELDAEAAKAMTKTAWGMPSYTMNQRRVMAKAQRAWFVSGRRNLAFCVVKAAREVGITEAEEVATLLLECVPLTAAVESTIAQQQEARRVLLRMLREEEQERFSLENRPTVAERSKCLVEGSFRIPDENDGIDVQLSKSAWLKVVAIGGCPKVLVDTYGGRWPRQPQRHISDVPCSQIDHSWNAHRNWIETLTEEARALFFIECAPSVVGPNEYGALGDRIINWMVRKGKKCHEVHTLAARRSESLRHMLEKGDASGDGWTAIVAEYLRLEYGAETEKQSDIPRRSSKGGMPITYTTAMVLEALPGAEPLIELLHNRDPGADESEIAGTVVGLLTLPKNVLIQLIAGELLDVPLNQWYREFSESLSATRRTLILGEMRGSSELLRLRKLLNVTIRTMDRPDMFVEDWNRGMSVTRKVCFEDIVERRELSLYTKYELAFRREAADVIEHTLGSMPDAARFRTMEDFWSERCIRGASGTSRAISKVPQIKEIEAFGDSDRPGKRVLVECLDDHALERIMRWTPQQRAYFFVKPEPGHKQRALYATYDEESFICAYANQAIENYMGREKGVFVRQTPADVLEWMAVSSGGLAGPEAHGCHWVSTDYSDYNSEHTLFEMTALDRACAEYYKRQEHAWSQHAQGAIEKMNAHNWCAAGRLKSVIVYRDSDKLLEEEGRLYLPVDRSTLLDERPARYLRVLNGLFSGSRTTARDNTWIHAVDVRIAKKTLQAIGLRDVMRWHAVCGDDEDVAFPDLASAAAYLTTLLTVNHALNPVKQLAGRGSHEFLQFVYSEDARIEKPMFTLLATLATGNWYVQKGVWIQTAIPSIIANYWELYARGCPLQVARRLATATLERLMYAKTKHPDGSVGPLKPLEWWKFRHAPGTQPLFHFGEGDESVAMPRFEALVEVADNWPRRGSEAYIRKQKSLLAELPSRMKKEMLEACLANTVGAAAKMRQQSAAKSWAAKYWPERESEPWEALPKHEDWRVSVRDVVDLADFRYGMPRKNEMLTEEDVAGRMGVPFWIVRRLGGADQMGKYLSPEAWGKYANTSDTFYPLNANGFELQSNLRAVLSWSNQPVRGFHGRSRSLRPERMLYIYMGNGAGKSHAAKITREAQDLDEVWMDTHGSIRQRADAAWSKSCFEPFSGVMQQLLAKARTRGSVLLGQVAPSLMLKAAEAIGVKLQVAFFDPGEAIRRERLLRRDGWDEARVQRRIARSNAAYEEARQLGARELRSQHELLSAVHEHTANERIRMEAIEPDLPKQPAKFVFDYSGPLSRRLEIEAELKQ